MSRGGVRVGAGRPPKSRQDRWLDGNAGKRGARDRKPPQLPALVAVVCPDTLNAREQAVWEALAPYALKEYTLLPATAGDFAMLCILEVEVADVLAERRKEGWSRRGQSLAREVRGLAQRIEAKRRAFRLAPMGKPMVELEAPSDEWAEFDGETVQ